MPVSAPTPPFGQPNDFNAAWREAWRYWEVRRIGYNAILTAITLGWLVLTWPHFRPALHWQSGLVVLVLAAIANFFYCFAYPLDLALQWSPVQSAWRARRWWLWTIGTVLASALTYHWIADEIYPYVN